MVLPHGNRRDTCDPLEPCLGSPAGYIMAGLPRLPRAALSVRSRCLAVPRCPQLDLSFPAAPFRPSVTSGGRIDPGYVRPDDARVSGEQCPAAAHYWPPGPTPPCSLHLAAPAHVSVRLHPRHGERQVAARCHSERCCGIPASRARTSVSRYRRWPPRVRIDVSFPALAHRVTVFGSTRNIVATSAGVSSGSASGVRADIITASPPGPVLRSCVCCCAGSLAEPAVDVPYGLLRPYCHHQP